ncbi:hypothetical protein OTU49_007301 [Cherax quadricarinatus]|uniref:Uncharacterized protein n=1 Tax=Cherax quadricarinatus TaxID=27406 RepID=A0AAW0WW39_CHEQU
MFERVYTLLDDPDAPSSSALNNQTDRLADMLQIAVPTSGLFLGETTDPILRVLQALQGPSSNVQHLYNNQNTIEQGGASKDRIQVSKGQSTEVEWNFCSANQAETPRCAGTLSDQDVYSLINMFERMCTLPDVPCPSSLTFPVPPPAPLQHR